MNIKYIKKMILGLFSIFLIISCAEERKILKKGSTVVLKQNDLIVLI